MGLVAPGVGWALQYRGAGPGSDDHLFWTSDDGGAWTDITPRDPASRQIAGVFFLDASRGWVLLALKHESPKNPQKPDNFITDIRGFDFASTTDGGANWTIKHLEDATRVQPEIDRFAVTSESDGWDLESQSMVGSVTGKVNGGEGSEERTTGRKSDHDGGFAR